LRQPRKSASPIEFVAGLADAHDVVGQLAAGRVGHPDLVGLVLGAEPAGHADEIVDREVVDPARISPIHNGPARFAVY
jgi:hypothetical protein